MQKNLTRKIVEDSDEWQVQEDTKTGVQYHYRKDYMWAGDKAEDYSLALMYCNAQLFKSA